jgi:hypothetical protein
MAVPAWAEEQPPLPAPGGAAQAEGTAQGGDPSKMPPAPPPIDEKQAPPVTGNKPEQTPTKENFQRTLSPYGRWVSTPEYGEVWIPNVSGDWRPYTNGEWANTDYGWTFVSYDPWGWAPFHYGRWFYYNPYGWAWIPGYEWAPAWVTWRYGGGYIGWAPLGPFGVGLGYYGYPSLWCFVGGRNFYGWRGGYWGGLVPTTRVGGILRTTYFAGVPRRGSYFSPPASYVSRMSGRPVARVSAARIAPSWVGRAGAYQPRAALASAYRNAGAYRGPAYRSYGGNYRGYGSYGGYGVYRGTTPYRSMPTYRGYGGYGGTRPPMTYRAPSTRTYSAPSRGSTGSRSFSGGRRR